MTETSRFWDGTATGDSTAAPYDAPTEFAKVLDSLVGAAARTNHGGVFRGELNEYFTIGATSPISVSSGRGMSWGSWHEADASVAIVVATPAASTRIDRVVLRKSWAAHTIRLTIIAGVEGGGAPALVQIAGTTWDVPLYQVSITTGGVITLTDQRQWLGPQSGVILLASQVADGIITSFDFQSIPSSFEGGVLEVRALLRSGGAVNPDNVLLRINGDTGATYDWVMADMTSAGATYSNSAGATSIQAGYMPGTTSPAGIMAQVDIDIDAYADNTWYHTVRGKSIDSRSLISGGFHIVEFGGNWRSNTTINRIQVLGTGSVFMAGSRCSLYMRP